MNDIKHTSNDLQYLKAIAPAYCGAENCVTQSAVTGKNIITANGTVPIEFAREIFRKLELYKEKDLKKWYQLFKNGIWV